MITDIITQATFARGALFEYRASMALDRAENCHVELEGRGVLDKSPDGNELELVEKWGGKEHKYRRRVRR